MKKHDSAELAAGDTDTTVVHADQLTHVAHTPGPWSWFSSSRITGNVREVLQERNGGIKYLVGADGQGFAHTVGLGRGVDEANVDLIAAAPEMYEALKAIADIYCRRVCPRVDDSVMGHEPDCKQIRAAIAKAEGR